LPENKVAVAARLRWVMIAIGCVAGVTLNFRSPQHLVIVLLAGIWLALVNGFVLVAERITGRFRFAGAIYFFGDYWLAAAFALLGTDYFIVAAILGLAMEFAIVFSPDLGPWFPLLLMACTIALLRNALLPEAYG